MSEQTVTPAEAAPVGEPAPVLPPAPAGASAGQDGGPVPVKPPRRVLRAVARWTAAVLVFGAVGTGTAFGIASMERTDVPGLATEGDGRWDYPELSLPALPEGSPRPFNPGNTAQIHHADLRKLLIPAPEGATVDKKLTGGWTTPEQFASEYGEGSRERVTGELRDSALRHIAVRGWTMPDGTESRVYLLRFNSVGYAMAFRDDLYIGSGPGEALEGKKELVFDEDWEGDGKVPGTVAYVYTDPAKNGREHMRAAYVQAGDTLALIVHRQEGQGSDLKVPFHQTVVLQNQLLG
ncbi:hypothetical protein CP967_15625 [Streptomyces nitrosporeus]|uniref:Uncharacterized protein n=1 Tax=Streptomyces nitrosporeus TaxID=28894 RepID=A0A5J6FBU9_9ACTN|nr:hypothetical protein [Streptomyces nitrosporeus]QEU73247.1 hypothetical protein CP967_15625 [Streptomyces nitrosporeus]GGZ09465.1 hypothetical protein GCM10010327_44950 [Streptomyces nitrosporeus]